MKDLIERLEKATGPDGELDAAIWLTVDRHTASRCYWNAAPGLPKPIPEALPLGLGRNAVISNSPRYTTSIDAALTLVPEGMWWLIGAGQMRPEEPLYGAQIRKPGFSTGGQVVSDAEHNCMAIALCIAALKARGEPQ